MTNEVAVPEDISRDLDISELDTPEKRFQGLSRTFVHTAMIISEMQKNEDWKVLKREDGSDYSTLTDLVQDALKISDSYARRLVQTSKEFYTPLESVTVEGTVINITSTNAAALGATGMKEVVDRVSDETNENQSPEEQAELIDAVTKDVLDQKRRSANPDDFGDDDDLEGFTLDDLDDFGDDDIDDFDGDDDVFASDSSTSSKKNPSAGDSGGSSEKPKGDKSTGGSKETPAVNYLLPIQEIMSGGKEYVTDEDLEELPEPLKEFVRVVNWLAGLDHEEITDMITEDRRGATYKIRKASSTLTLIVSSVETSPWVLEKI